jgi:SOS-response transcriptional repressor LexA
MGRFFTHEHGGRNTATIWGYTVDKIKIDTRQPLTPNQHQCLMFIKDYMYEHHGRAPSMYEIGEFMGCRSPGTGRSYVLTLQNKGYLHKLPGLARALEIIE